MNFARKPRVIGECLAPTKLETVPPGDTLQLDGAARLSIGAFFIRTHWRILG